MMCRTLALTSCLCGLALTTPVRADEPATPATGDRVVYEVEEGKLLAIRGETREEIPLPAAAVALAVSDERLYVALGVHGMAVLRVGDGEQPSLTRHVPVSHGAVTGFIEVDGQLWMTVDSTTAVRVAEDAVVVPVSGAGVTPLVQPTPEADEQTAPAPAAHADAAPSPAHPVTILERYTGAVKLDTGADDGVVAGDRFAVFRSAEFTAGEEEEFVGVELVAVLEVQAVGETTSLARVWRGDRVSSTDEVVAGDEELEPSKVYPRHLPRLGEVTLVLRPIINVGNDGGFGALCDLAIAWWGHYYFVDVRMQPLGFGWVAGGKIVTNSLLAEAGYNGRAFAVGMGIGLASVNGDMDEMLGYSGATSGMAEDGTTEPQVSGWEQRTQHGFSLSQVVRLGAMDGLNLKVSNILIYHEDDGDGDEDESSGFIWGGITGRFAFPLALRVDMFLEGGGGFMGYWFAAIGIFTWLRGNGDAGSVGISASAGGAGLSSMRERDYGDYVDTERLRINGPMFSLGLVARFGPSID